MLRALVPLLALTATVSAEPHTLEGRQREVALGDRKNVVNAHAFAELGGGQIDQQAAADVAAGAEVFAAGRTCDFFRAGGQGRLRYDDGWHASAEQWASVCAPLHATVIELGHELEWDVRPSLLAPLGLRPGLNRRETLRVRWAPVRLAVSDLQQDPTVRHVPPGGAVQGAPNGELVVFDVNTEMSWLWSSPGNVALHALPDATPFGYRRDQDAPWGEARDFEVRVFRAGGEFAENAASVGLWIAQLDNLKLGPLFIDVGIGFASAGAGAFVTDTKRQVEVTVPRASVAIETGGTSARVYANATSDVTLAPDGYVVIDHRVTSGGTLDLGATRIALDGTIARDDVRMPPAQRMRATVGGGSLSLVRALGPHLRASLQVEVARSFYAQTSETAPMQDFAPRWGTRALAVLQAFASH
jgi:hypothetical protein